MRATAILAALPYAVKRIDDEVLYRKYVTDTLYYGFRGDGIAQRYSEMIGLEKREVADERTGDEIAADVINRMGLNL
jgi:hypothetical protein